MRISIIYDNTAYDNQLREDWGFAAFLETKDKNILFDTGANGAILLSNMQKLKISPDEIDTVFISHAHWDHAGGLNDFLKENNNVDLWIPPSFHFQGSVRKILDHEVPATISKGIHTTGQLEGIEQALCVETSKGVVVIVGCAHPDMKNILHTASRYGQAYAVIGGMHGTNPKSLKEPDLICPTHCTQYKAEMKNLYPEKYMEGGTGRVVEIE